MTKDAVRREHIVDTTELYSDIANGTLPAVSFVKPRIPLLVVSPHTKRGHISHSYADHISILKFIERNWSLPTISERSRDNLPNPKLDWDNPYVPKNRPAIRDLFDLLDFDHCDFDNR